MLFSEPRLGRAEEGPSGSEAMHHLFGLVLAQKDLSRAGDLFSLEDAEIEGSLSEALEQIRIISSSAVSEAPSLIFFRNVKCINKMLKVGTYN